MYALIAELLATYDLPEMRSSLEYTSPVFDLKSAVDRNYFLYETMIIIMSII